MADQTKNNSFLDLATSNLPLISIILLGISFLNHYLFYYVFSIPIYNYIQITELITLFVPVFISYCVDAVLAILIIYLFTSPLLLIGYQSPNIPHKIYSKKGVKVEDHLEIIYSARRMNAIRKVYLGRAFRKKQYTKISGYIFILLLSLYINLSYLLLFLMGPAFVYISFDDDTIHHQSARTDIGFVVLLYVWVVFSFDMIFRYSNYYIFKIKNERYLTIAYGLKVIFYILLFIFSLNFNSATNIKSGYSVYDVEFKYKDTMVKTDTNLVYIGATQNYLFLRERKTRKNFIYKTDQIENFTLKKIAYENKQLAWIKGLTD